MMQMIQSTHLEDVLSVQESALLDESLGDASPVLLLRTKTRIDTGRWLRKSALWLCVTQEHMLLFATSKRRYVQQMPLADCKGSTYCHTSGALLLQPSDHWRFNTITLLPTDAVAVLQHLDNAKTQTQPSPVTEPTGA